MKKIISKYSAAITSKELVTKIEELTSSSKLLYNIKNLSKLFGLIDLTTLKETDTNESVLSMVNKVNHFHDAFDEEIPNVAAICVYPPFIEGIKKEMPGIKTKDWDFSSAKTKVKRSNYESALSKYIVNMGTGSLTMSEVKKALGMSKATCERLTSKMKDENSDLHKAMFKVGASYKSKGPGKRAYIIKDSLEA